MSVLSPTDDATLTALSATPAGSAATLTVCTSNTTNHATTSVAVLAFSVPPTATVSQGLTAALLEVTLAQQLSSVATNRPMIMSVFAAQCNAAWGEGTVTWAGATGFAVKASSAMTAAITSISQNFAPADESASALAGHVTVTTLAGAGTRFAVDVTDAVQQCAGGTVTFTVARRFRNNLYTGNAGGSIAADTLSWGAAAVFHSKEAADADKRPVLRLLQTPLA